MSDRTVLAETATTDGTRVVLSGDTRADHVLNPGRGHAELQPHLDAHQEDDVRPGRQRFYKQAWSKSVADGRRMR